ncbi:3-hydroxyisobutyrate dehydrogenase [Oceanicola sp. 502str15]|uniref:3-hydroxyisobutyrate dehydrogenase n=1 Tax=Oceanicola sp. 502str15 TaxID=2696061 RepID=UPI0020953D56|nr:3-hydroxyisobutyrate dehydrogenase [Oceanicola sp. 502str15]MCO6381732.1 3-hydroxyisobutyrate dehydrogenase [Oceanicola sp. 502str15]
MSKTIAFIGLGNMGGPMSGNLVKAGHVVQGYDLSEAARRAAETQGVLTFQDLKEAVQGADAIITMLPNGPLVLDVWGQLAEIVPAGTILIDSSTIDVDSAIAAHELLTSKGCLTLDAPVSGGTGGAEAGSLTFMTGGSEAALQSGAPLLEPMAGRVVRCGSPGAGQAAKICNNMLLGISMIGACEAFALGEKLGLEHQALFDVISTSSGQCWSVNTNCPVPGPVPTSPANRAYQPGFAAALMLKDLRLAQQAALSRGAQTPLGAEAAQLYGMYDALDEKGSDFSGIISLLRGAADRASKPS